jgi:hypothetical protein
MKTRPMHACLIAAALLVGGAPPAVAQVGSTGGARSGEAGGGSTGDGGARAGSGAGGPASGGTSSGQPGHLREGTTDPRGTGGSMGGGSGSPTGTTGR